MSSARDVSFQIEPGGRLAGRVRVPGDKSISHRFVMLGALAEGRSHASGFLEGEDALATVKAFRDMGIEIEGPEGGCITISGAGLDGLSAPAGALDMGNSGTAMRLLTGVLAGQRFHSTLVGDESLSRRPMGRIIEPLMRMGATIASAPGGTPPLRVSPARRELSGIDYALPVASAQVKSCLMLAGLYAGSPVVVREPGITRDHTERMLRGFGVDVEAGNGRVTLRPGQRLSARTMAIPADISSAAFFLVGACIAEGSDLVLENVGVNPTRTGVLQVLQAMGANIEPGPTRDEGGEPVADLRVRHAPLRGIEIPRQAVPLAIDELPAIMVAAAFARGTTRLRGAAELRVKESDRIAAVAGGLAALGVAVQEYPDGMCVRGGRPGGGMVDSLGDHRIAMAFAMAGLGSNGSVRIGNCANVDTSFPGFAQLAAEAGLRIRAG